ncbi:hypothetical protein QVD17_05966 [Tagetes erecta]|uniref:Uncharacterized protein n=1 Tax=Tagetes erecta TaxID=13708 RepID=A0AAD8LJP6_TARER|nr:hypothetical protein QVD17_05966 [Tagetes erecta]
MKVSINKGNFDVTCAFNRVYGVNVVGDLLLSYEYLYLKHLCYLVLVFLLVIQLLAISHSPEHGRLICATTAMRIIV